MPLNTIVSSFFFLRRGRTIRTPFGKSRVGKKEGPSARKRGTALRAIGPFWPYVAWPGFCLLYMITLIVITLLDLPLSEFIDDYLNPA